MSRAARCVWRPGSAEQAFEAGLADRLADSDALLDQAFEVAAAMAANPEPQLRMIKELLSRNGSATDLKEIQQRETEQLRICWQTPEHREAVRAFIEKRAPVFSRRP